jgi:catechol 2,3-dioxygenase-like lactoylglutathione lyase family enzyme
MRPAANSSMAWLRRASSSGVSARAEVPSRPGPARAAAPGARPPAPACRPSNSRPGARGRGFGQQRGGHFGQAGVARVGRAHAHAGVAPCSAGRTSRHRPSSQARPGSRIRVGMPGSLPEAKVRRYDHRFDRPCAAAPGMSDIAPFHLAFPVHDLAATRHFYGEVLGCAEGRSSADWIDFNLFGHQIVAHLVPPAQGAATCITTRWTAMVCRCRTSAWCWPGPTSSPLRSAARQGRAVCHRAVHPLCRPGGRTGHDVLPRPQRQRAGVQGLPGPQPTLCQVTRP